MAKTVEEYIRDHAEWSEGLHRFRAVITGFELEETVKWGMPYYRIGSHHVVGLAAFKRWIALWFERGYAMDDPLGVLVNASPDKTKWQRQWRIEDPALVRDDDVRDYIAEALRVTEAEIAAGAKG